ncbi:MAG: hypothetical protein ACU84Q_17500 [Gammaproteobacteria bacterium]
MFNVVGIADLILAVSLGVLSSAASEMGATSWIPALWVPSLLVSRGLIFEIPYR